MTVFIGKWIENFHMVQWRKYDTIVNITIYTDTYHDTDIYYNRQLYTPVPIWTEYLARISLIRNPWSLVYRLVLCRSWKAGTTALALCWCKIKVLLYVWSLVYRLILCRSWKAGTTALALCWCKIKVLLYVWSLVYRLILCRSWKAGTTALVLC